MRPCDQSIFESMGMRRETRWEGREIPIGKVGGTQAQFAGTFASQQDTQCWANAHKENRGFTGRLADKAKAWGEFWLV